MTEALTREKYAADLRLVTTVSERIEQAFDAIDAAVNDPGCALPLRKRRLTPPCTGRTLCLASCLAFVEWEHLSAASRLVVLCLGVSWTFPSHFTYVCCTALMRCSAHRPFIRTPLSTDDV